MTTIALDAMGGDHAPRIEVEGAILAARELGVRVLLVGIEATVREELDRHKTRGLPIEIVNATEVITMTDSPSHAFRRKKESSLHVAARLVRDARADALVSAGNTGARIGSTNSSVAITSRKQPSTSRRTLIASRNCHGAMFCASTHLTSSAGTPEAVIQWPNAKAVATISMIAPALFSASATTHKVSDQ